jgi:hypothetical protein
LTPTAALKHYALRLKNADPESWDRFIVAFDALATDVTVAVTTASSEEILRCQGRAQQMLALLRLFQECHLTREPPK